MELKDLLEKTLRRARQKQGATSYYFSLYDGLLDKKHKKNMGLAIWEFLWCLNRTTKEIIIAGKVWGLVWGGRPVTAETIAQELGGHPETVKSHLRKLAEEGYIKLKRHPRGYIIWVKDSKKWRKEKITKTGDK